MGSNSETSYRQFVVWQKSMDLVVEVYRCTKSFPRDEVFGLISQMRRASISVPSNISEGKGRYTNGELVRFLFNARGSLLELQTQITLAGRLGYLPEMRVMELEQRSAEVGRMLNGLTTRFRIQSEPVATK
jgi:four helix bundle protein